MEIKVDTVSYIDEKNKVRLQNISAEFYPSHVYGIIGSSGSGKSFLGKLLAGIIRQTSGEISFDNIIMKHYTKLTDYSNIRTKIGYLAETMMNQFCYDTVYEELKHQILKYHYRENELEKRIYDALKVVGLKKSIAHSSPLNLSTGEQKKLGLAVALIHNPEVLVLDEPTLGLDPFEQKKLIKLVRMLKTRYHKTIIIITNDLEFLIQIIDEIVVLDHGTIAFFNKKYQVLKETRKLKKLGIEVPTTIYFSDLVLKKKKIKIGYRDQMDDLIKDVYRFSEWGVKHYE